MIIIFTRLSHELDHQLVDRRMRAVTGADKIVVIKDGRVDEQGKPSELKAKNGVYSKMLSLQQNP